MVLVSLWSNVALSVKRLHDIDRPGIIAVVLFIPVISIVAFIALCLIPGNPGPNQYGEPSERAGRRLRWRPSPVTSAATATLDPKLIIETAAKLEQRVAERFPDSGLRASRPNSVLSQDLADFGQGAGGADLVGCAS